ncbi:MAG: sigma-54-dependent Fis family transcriptional regulator [Deltaproteobacteria bacterium]|nr:sigma-54-dependent Fis family transcriptional regulator [Deltaproteobacteria bacterium]
MTEPRATILLTEDSTSQRDVLSGFLSRKKYRVLAAASAAEALALALETPVDLLLSDLRLGGPDGISLLEELRKSNPALQAIILSAYGTVEDATRAMKAGAYDFLAKPVELGRLEALVEKALEKVSLAREVGALTTMVKNSGAFEDVVGDSTALNQIISTASRAAASNASILILGESGTGKGVLARAIHMASPRKKRPFHTVNCAALPENLIEAELFGYEAGAFTGAASRKPGRFELANGGTLFLDEVGEIPLHIQVKLLNVLQSRSFERLGGTETISTDIRIIAATNQDAEAQVREGAFRQDLFFRLNVVTITLPPLRDRTDDIPLLASHFIEKHSNLLGVPVRGISADAIALLKGCPFPGNIRELENWIERAIVLAEGDSLTARDFPTQVSAHTSSSESDVIALFENQGLEEQIALLETRLIRAALEKHHLNQSAAARALKISERAIRYKMKKYGI